MSGHVGHSTPLGAGHGPAEAQHLCCATSRTIRAERHDCSAQVGASLEAFRHLWAPAAAPRARVPAAARPPGAASCAPWPPPASASSGSAATPQGPPFCIAPPKASVWPYPDRYPSRMTLCAAAILLGLTHARLLKQARVCKPSGSFIPLTAALVHWQLSRSWAARHSPPPGRAGPPAGTGPFGLLLCRLPRGAAGASLPVAHVSCILLALSRHSGRPGCAP